jgi:hypothetical protein
LRGNRCVHVLYQIYQMRNITKECYTDQQFLLFLLRKSNKTSDVLARYTSFCQSLDTAFIHATRLECGVDVRPYLFSVFCISENEFATFLTFLRRYVSLPECYLTKNKCNTDILMSIMGSSPFSLFGTVIVMQYYFV